MGIKRTGFLLLAAAVAMVLSGVVVAFDGTERAEAALTTDPGTIAFQSTRNSAVNTNSQGGLEIFTMNSDGSGTRQLTFNDVNDSTPSLSPDGKQIVFVSVRDGNQEIYKMNSDGSAQRRLTDKPSSETFPAFSPDGRKIFFASDRDGDREIYSMNSDGSGTPKKLTNNAADDTQPAVSPLGKKIAFASNRSGSWEIYAMRTDGSGQRRLTNDPLTYGEDSPDFSADGKKIAFRSAPDIFVMNADGSGRINLTEGGGTSSVWREDIFIGSPSFSPDGTHIAFHTATEFYDLNGGPQFDIFVMNSDGSGQTQITQDGANSSGGIGGGSSYPDWQ